MSRGRSCLALALAAAGLLACGGPTELIVEVTVASSLPPIAVAVAEIRDEIDTRIDGPRSFEVAPGGSSFVVVPRGGDASRVARVVVTGCASPVAEGSVCPVDDVVASHIVHASFVPGRIVRIRIELSAGCTGRTCPLDTVCRATGPGVVCAPIEEPDAGMDAGRDASRIDAGARDVGAVDAPGRDTGVRDTGAFDAPRDAASFDATEACPNGDLAMRLGAAVASGSTVGAADDFTPTCSTSAAPDRTFTWTSPASATYTFDTAGSSYDTILALFSGCGGAQLACHDDVTAGSVTTSSITRFVAGGESLLVVVDGYSTRSGSFTLNIQRFDGDAGPDAPARDAGMFDAGRADGGADAALRDAGAADASEPDAATPDAATSDAATSDAATSDAATSSLDAFATDAATTDAASTDAADGVDAPSGDDDAATEPDASADGGATEDAP